MLFRSWWQHIGLSWSAVLPGRGIVTPVSHLETHFVKPSKFGDALAVALTVESVGRSSVRLALRLSEPARQELRLLARVRMVCVSVQDHAPRAWPDDVRATLRSWRGDPHAPA